MTDCTFTGCLRAPEISATWNQVDPNQGETVLYCEEHFHLQQNYLQEYAKMTNIRRIKPLSTEKEFWEEYYK